MLYHAARDPKSKLVHISPSFLLALACTFLPTLLRVHHMDDVPLFYFRSRTGGSLPL